MKITEYAIKNHQFTLVMVLMVIAVGISTLLKMPRSEDPEFDAPFYPIIVVYPGASPEDMEKLVVDPIEKKVYGLQDIKRIRSFIRDGLAVMQVDYNYHVDVNDKYNELIREVNALRDKLPREVRSIEVQKATASDVNILQVALISENTSRDALDKAGDDLQAELEKVTQLKNVKVNGAAERIVRVDLHLEKMAHLHIPALLVANALQSESANIPGGNIIEGTKSFNVKTNSNYSNLQEIRNTIITGRGVNTILLKDIADVYYDYGPDTYITRLNGHLCIFVNAALKPGENISLAQESYKPILEKFRAGLPSNIDMQAHFDQADNVNDRLYNLGLDFLIAIGLVLITLLPLGNRASLVVMIAIPLSIGIGVILLNLFGYNLNQLSIVGLVVALGLLVDDSIVVVENIERWIREGHSRLDATIKGTGQIGMAVLGCTATLIIAFLPLAFMPEGSGDFIRSLPLAVIFTILGSLIVALTIVPFLSSRILKPAEGDHSNIFLRGLQKVIHGTYARLLDVALRHPVLSLLIALSIFVGSLFLIPVVGTSLFPASEKPQFTIDITAPLQSGIYNTDSITRQIEAELAKMPEVKYYSSNIGKGNPRIYYNVIQRNEQADFAQIFVQLHPDIRPDEKLNIIKELRRRWTPYPGAEVKVVNFEQGIPQIAPIEVRLLGDNLDTLRQLASDVENMLVANPGAIYVSNPVKNNKTDIRIHIDKEKAQSLGVPTINISQTVRMALAGIPVGTYTDKEKNNNDYTIVVTKPRESYPDLSVFRNLFVNASDGRAIPIDQITDIGFETSAQTINHLNKVRTVSVTAFIREGHLNSAVINDVVKALEQKKFPKGYSFTMGGEVEGREESFKGFGYIILVTVFLFIAVLVLQFRTFKSTLIVLSVIPLGIVGAVLALLVTGNSLSFVATVGIVALAGIEVKNTILLVDFTNQLRKQGVGLMEAIEEAGEKRFLPIILTTMTAIGGLMPIAWSNNPLISPLAIVMIGGLISSTFLSRIVTPVVYKLIPPKV
ncbi:MAG TPA: efflux RND transporter permease subunit [Saprospiraceae bacterium]|nr:efflux RND transporter permease subunit [Saprospiraceae bacterium]HRP84707.1 efflux RND transporter permease subunit [Saprospiraceae bacterium]